MSTTTIMTARERAQTLGDECLRAFPVIVLGSGASAAHGIPAMGPLRDELAKSKPPAGLCPEDQSIWEQFLKAAATMDLESALNAVRLSDVLTQHVVETTWRFLTPSDIALLFKVTEDRNHLPLSRLFKHLFRSTRAELNVVTTNYDRIPEYAANAAGFHFFTGFDQGYLGRHIDRNVKTTINGTLARTIHIWKVHGSLDWFRDTSGLPVALPVQSNYPSTLVPEIITPGIEKYRLTWNEPYRSIQTASDSALKSAKSYLCIGYGFNDAHIQEKLVENCRDPSVMLVILTKDLTPKITEFLKSGHCKNYLVLTNFDGTLTKTTRMYSPDYPLPDGVDIVGETYWTLDGFLTLVT